MQFPSFIDLNQKIGLSDLLELVTASTGVFIALLALVFSLWTYWRGLKREEENLARAEATDRRNLTLAIWQIWISQDYRRYRTAAWKFLIDGDVNPEGLSPMHPILQDKQADEAIGSIEHFIDEVSKIVQAELIDKTLFDALFRTTFIAWASLFYRFDRARADAFSAKETERAFRILLGEEHRKLAEEKYLARKCNQT